MRILYSISRSGIDIGSITEVARYYAPGPLLVTSRLTMNGVVGASLYRIRLYLNGIEVVPDPDISVSGTSAVFQSRAVWVNTADVLSVSVAGTGSDTAVNLTCFMIDVSPVAEADTKHLTDAIDDVMDTLQTLISEQHRLYDRQVLGA